MSLCNVCKKYLPIGGARVQTPVRSILTKEMSTTTHQQKLEMTKIPYQQVAGSLFVLSWDRELVLRAVTCCAKYSFNPGKARWLALLLRYLWRTKGHGLVYKRHPRDVEFGCYAEWAPDYQLDPQ